MNRPKRLHDAKQQRENYRQEPDDGEKPSAASQGKRTLSEWTDIVGQRIEQAMREGAFDNLPGQGKPLDLNKNPFVPEDRQMAYKLLENNDLAPSWISERTSVLDAVETLQAEIHAGVRSHQAVHRRTSAPDAVEDADSRWSARLATWADDIAAINKRIESVNLQQPIAHLEIFKLRLADELTRAGVEDRPPT